MDFFEFELSLLITCGTLIGDAQHRLGTVERLIWLKASRREDVARGLMLARDRWSDAPAAVTQFQPALDQVSLLAGLLEQAGLPDRLPQIQIDPSSTCDVWQQILLRLKVDFEREACYELNYVTLEEGEDCSRLRSALQFLYRMAGCSEWECERVL